MKIKRVKGCGPYPKVWNVHVDEHEPYGFKTLREALSFIRREF